MKKIILFFILSIEPWFLNPSFAQESSRFFQNVTVETGDTLWSLAHRYLKDPQRWPEILKHNKLPTSDPTVALPGMVLRIPVLEIKESLRAAKLMEWVNVVSYRQAQSAVWQDVTHPVDLLQDYGVRTGDASWTRIRFAVGEDLTLGANSFALIRPQGLSENTERGANLLLGEARSKGVRLMTQTAQIVPRSKDTDYRARIRDDLATVVEVYQGSTDVEAKGKTVKVEAGFATEVSVGKPPALPVRLPPMPETVLAPLPQAMPSAQLPDAADLPDTAQGKIILRAGTISINVLKNPSSAAAARGTVSEGLLRLASYRVQVARQKDFREILWDRSYPIEEKFILRETGLPDGQYYFRVSYVDRLGFESPFNRGEPLTIDTQPPRLEITSPAQADFETQASPIRLAGRSEPGVLLMIQGRAIAVDGTGNFSVEHPLKPGQNTLVITAMDNSGNTSELKRSIRYVPRDTESAIASRRQEEVLRSVDNPERSMAAEKAGKTALGLATVTAIIGIVLLLLAG